MMKSEVRVKLENGLIEVMKDVMPKFLNKVIAITESDQNNAVKVDEIQKYCLKVKSDLKLL